MKGSAKVIEELNAALSGELTAIAQYMVQAEMHANWGYRKLSGITKHRAIEEMRHAEGLIERVLFLDGMPDVKIALTPKIGKTVKAHLEQDLQDELDAIKQYNAAIAVCKAESDNGSRELFESMVKDEERHADYLEAQLHAIGEVGVEIYLSQQMDAAKK